MSAPPPSPAPAPVRPPTGRTAAIALDPEGTVRLLQRVLAGSPALPGALCRSNPELFDERDPSDPDRPAAEAAALDICSRCPALAACREWFDALPRSRRPAGVVAGQANQPQRPGRPRAATA